MKKQPESLELYFDSVSELFDTCHLKPSEENKDHHTHLQMKADSSYSGGYSFYGTKNPPKEIPAMIIAGHKPGLDSIVKARETLSDTIKPVPSIRRKRARGATGDELDIHRVNRGELDKAWSRSQKTLDGLRAKTGEKLIVVDVGQNAAVDSDQLKWVGAYASVLAEHYANAGFNVEIWAFANAQNPYAESKKQDLIKTAVKVLSSDVPFNLETLANTLCFPGFFRTLIFESWLTIKRRLDYGLGQSHRAIPDRFKTKRGVLHIKDILSLDNIIQAEKNREIETENGPEF